MKSRMHDLALPREGTRSAAHDERSFSRAGSVKPKRLNEPRLSAWRRDNLLRSEATLTWPGILSAISVSSGGLSAIEGARLTYIHQALKQITETKKRARDVN